MVDFVLSEICLAYVSLVLLLFSCVWHFATPWTWAHQASLSFTISWSLLKLISIELVMSSSHLILFHPLLLLPTIFPSLMVFSKELALRITWPKYWRFSFSISPSNAYSAVWVLVLFLFSRGVCVCVCVCILRVSPCVSVSGRVFVCAWSLGWAGACLGASSLRSGCDSGYLPRCVCLPVCRHLCVVHVSVLWWPTLVLVCWDWGGFQDVGNMVKQ